MRHIQTLDRLAPVTDSRETVDAQTVRQQSRMTWSLEWLSGRSTLEPAVISVGQGGQIKGLTGSQCDRDRSFDLLPTPAMPGCGMLTITHRLNPRNPRLYPVLSRTGYATAPANRDGARLNLC